MASASMRDVHVFMTMCGGNATMHSALLTVRSIYDSAPISRRLRLHVLHDDGAPVHHLLSTLNRFREHGLFQETRFQVDGHAISRALSSSDLALADATEKRFKQCAAARMFIPHVRAFQDLHGPGIYLDADTIVRRDLYELVELVSSSFNQTQWCALARECELGPTFCWYRYWASKVGLRLYDDNGLNSGVMAFDLDRWCGKAAHQMHRHMQHSANNPLPGRLSFGDQDVLNSYFAEHRDELHVLPCEWNYRADLDSRPLKEEAKAGVGCVPKHHDDGRASIAVWHGNRNILGKDPRDVKPEWAAVRELIRAETFVLPSPPPSYIVANSAKGPMRVRSVAG